MSIQPIERELERLGSEAERIFAWRVAELRRAGYPARIAFKLAVRPEIDLHRAVELVRRGCPHDTALRILV